MDRITRLLALLQARGNETRIGRTGELHHAVSVFIGRVSALMRRAIRRNEQDPVEREGVRGFARDYQVRGVNRVEGASENRGLHTPRRRRSSSSFSISTPIFSHTRLDGRSSSWALGGRFIMSFSVVASVWTPAADARAARRRRSESV